MIHTRKKRTYNLSAQVIATVHRLAERKVAPTQDAVVEMAINNLARRVREMEESKAWAQAARDPLFTAEMDRLDAEFQKADGETWPPA